MSPLSPAQGNRCSSIVHLVRKKRARKGKTSGSASFATLASIDGTLHAALLSLRCRYVCCSHWACHLVFSAKRSLSRHPRLPLPPNPSRFRLRSIVLNWGQPPLIVRLACGSRGRRSVTVFACYVTFFCSRPYSEVWQRSLLSCLNSLSSHILSTQRRACLHSLHYVPPIPLRYIKLHCIHSFDKPSSDPAKKLHSTQKLRQPSLGCHRTHCATLHSVLPASRPRSTRNGFALHFGGRESTPLSLRRFPTASLLKAVFPCAGERGVAIPNQNNC